MSWCKHLPMWVHSSCSVNAGFHHPPPSHHVLLLRCSSRCGMELRTLGRETIHDLGWVQLGTAYISTGNCPFHLLQWTDPPQRRRLDFTHKWGVFMEFDSLWRNTEQLLKQPLHTCSVDQPCLTLCDPMHCSMPGFPVHHQLLKFAQELVMLSNHLILCHPLFLLPSIFPSIKVFSNESDLCIRWPKYWSFSFSISPSSEYSGLISVKIDWFDLVAVQGTLKSSSPTPLFKGINCLALSLLYGPTLTSIHDYWKTHSFDYMYNTLFQQHKRRLYTWTSPDDQHQNQIDCILCSQKWRSCIQSAKTMPSCWMWLVML